MQIADGGEAGAGQPVPAPGQERMDQMSDQTGERIEGKLDEVKGHVKSTWGEATGDERTRIEGEIDKAKGKAKQGVADAKERIDDTVQDLTNR
jgi:uncharacterized protein YjbJ (UPF0337 family)